MIDPELGRRAYRRQQRVFAWFFGTIAALFVVTVLVAGVFSEQQPWLPLLEILLVALPCCALLPGLVFVGHRTGWRAFRPAAVYGTDADRERRVRAAVESGRHLEGEDEELALDLARNQLLGRWACVLPFPVAPILYATVVWRPGEQSWLRVLGFCVLGAASAVVVWREGDRARRYLAIAGR